MKAKRHKSKKARKPRTPKAKSPKPRKPAARTRATTVAPVLTDFFGWLLRIDYQRADGKGYSAKELRGARISVTKDGKALIIDRVNVNRFVEGARA